MKTKPETVEDAPGAVTGLGGVFLKARDPDTLRAWYRDHLGLHSNEHGVVVFGWRGWDRPKMTGHTIWSLFPADSDYFAPSDARVMLNYRTPDLDALLARLEAAGVRQAGDVQPSPFGRFAWVLDAEDNKVELWEPPGDTGAFQPTVPAAEAVAGGPFLGARPSLGVRDVDRSLTFYRDILGFSVHATLPGENPDGPPSFALIERDAASLTLVATEAPAVATFAAVYLEVTDVHTLHEVCETAGAAIAQPVTEQPWKMTDFVVVDPDGHRIAIGQRSA